MLSWVCSVRVFCWNSDSSSSLPLQWWVEKSNNWNTFQEEMEARIMMGLERPYSAEVGIEGRSRAQKCQFTNQ